MKWLEIIWVVELCIIAIFLYKSWQQSRAFTRKLREGPMSQREFDIYLLDGDTKTYVYTTDRHDNVKALLKDLGFELQCTVFSYGWSVVGGHIYSIPKYFDMEDKDRMLRLVKINNGTDAKIRKIYKEIMDAKIVAGKRWWQHYSVKKRAST